MKKVLIIKLKKAINDQWYMIVLDNQATGDFRKAGSAYIAWLLPGKETNYRVNDTIEVPTDALEELK